jgi:hypothetical protein
VRHGSALGLFIVLGLALLGCSSDGSDDGTGASGGGSGALAATGGAGGASAGSGGGGTGGAGGTNGSSGGTAGGGTGGAGTGGSTGGTAGSGGGTQTNAHCEPGTHYENFRAYTNAGGPISNCLGYDPTQLGLDASESISVRSIALAAPANMMAFSIAWDAGGAQIEFWGANEECGAGAERLTTGSSQAPNISCFEWQSSTSYPHILMVYRSGGGQHGEVVICPTGSCPP